MFYTNTSTLLLLHEDRVKHLQKMHEPLPFLSRWSFRGKSRVQDASSSTTARKERRTT
jgi:hypothetical protein